MSELNRARLLSAVMGDWTPYTRTSKGTIYDTIKLAGGEDFNACRELEMNETDYDLLRHDIHVLLHETGRKTRRRKPPSGGD